MADLLQAVINAHGGIDRWSRLHSVTAHLAQGGAGWAMSGHEGILADSFVTASLHEQRVSYHPFGAPGQRAAYTPERVAIVTDSGDELEALDHPAASFGVHGPVPWTTLQVGYVAGTSIWAWLTQPFTYALPGFQVTEPGPVSEKGEELRRLRVRWPDGLAAHSSVQTIYVGGDGLIRRHDYEMAVMDGHKVAHFVSGYTEVAGIMVATRHAVFPRADGQALSRPLLISADISQVSFA
ncbi:MAG TPA: hypothetical protein VMG38_01385 [Trebonia sp.]|nr:hypothetical protein [Trebonia sp.]